MTQDLALLTGSALEQACQGLSARWMIRASDDSHHSALTCELKFRDFRQAFAFMCEAAMLAEKADHHPEWFNVYNRVNIVLTTHDAGGITAKDIALAKHMDAALAGYLLPSDA